MAKVLIVEDDTSLSEIYQIRLQAEGFDVITAMDGEEGLAVAIREKPDLILSDVMMPRVSGFDMLDILKSTPNTQHIKIIMMTALSSEDQRERGTGLGADAYLVKSQVGIEDVVTAVKKLLSGGKVDTSPAGGVTAETHSVVPEPVIPAPVANVAPVSPSTANSITAVPVVEPAAPVVEEPVAVPAEEPPVPEPIETPVPTEATEPAPAEPPIINQPEEESPMQGTEEPIIPNIPAPADPVTPVAEPVAPEPVSMPTPPVLEPISTPEPVAPVAPVVEEPVAAPAGDTPSAIADALAGLDAPTPAVIGSNPHPTSTETVTAETPVTVTEKAPEPVEGGTDIVNIEAPLPPAPVAEEPIAVPVTEPVAAVPAVEEPAVSAADAAALGGLSGEELSQPPAPTAGPHELA